MSLSLIVYNLTSVSLWYASRRISCRILSLMASIDYRRTSSSWRIKVSILLGHSSIGFVEACNSWFAIWSINSANLLRSNWSGRIDCINFRSIGVDYLALSLTLSWWNIGIRLGKQHSIFKRNFLTMNLILLVADLLNSFDGVKIIVDWWSSWQSFNNLYLSWILIDSVNSPSVFGWWSNSSLKVTNLIYL